MRKQPARKAKTNKPTLLTPTPAPVPRVSLSPAEEAALTSVNIDTRRKKKLDCRSAIEALWDRTTLVKLFQDDDDSKREQLQDFLDELKSLHDIDVALEHVAVYQVNLTEDYEKKIVLYGDDYYGWSAGFSPSEKKKVYKIAPSGLDPAALAKRRVPRINTTQPAVNIIKDSDGDTILIHLQNVLTDTQVMSRNHLKNVFFGKMVEGWCKSCGISGFLNLGALLRDIRTNEAAQRSYFGRFFREYFVDTVIPTYSGRGSTARTHYINREGMPKTFQAGNHIKRAIINGDDSNILDRR